MAQSSRQLLRFTHAAFASVMALVVIASATFAGRRYLYCHAMQRVMTHACCERAAAPTVHEQQQAQAQEHDQPAVASVEAECCQSRANASAAVFVPAARSHDPTAPFVATVPRAPLMLASFAEARTPGRSLAVRAGPPLSRALAQLMVFRI